MGKHVHHYFKGPLTMDKIVGTFVALMILIATILVLGDHPHCH